MRGTGDPVWLRYQHGPVVVAQEALGGVWDASALLVLRCVRYAAYLIVFAGTSVAWTSGQLERVDEMSTVQGLLGSLLTPLYLLAVGLGLRLLVSPTAWLLALVVVFERGKVRDHHAQGGASLGWIDVGRTVSALSALRWSVYVRRHAVTVVGPWGRGLWICELVLRVWTGIALVVLVIVVLS
ncbi:MAG: hypothetical protein ABI720_08835 [Actinomycetes bacterium]